MVFSFSIVKKMVIKAWIGIAGGLDEKYMGWSLKDALTVFKLFADTYVEKFRVSPPHLSQQTVDWIVSELPGDGTMAFDSLDYEAIIPAYFETKFKGRCNYGMAHFMSGEVRQNRYFEEIL